MTHRITLTFNDVNYRALLQKWGSEAGYREWVKAQTLAALSPPPYPDLFVSQYID